MCERDGRVRKGGRRVSRGGRVKDVCADIQKQGDKWGVGKFSSPRRPEVFSEARRDQLSPVLVETCSYSQGAFL